MDIDTLRYIMGAMVAAIVHLYFESRNCRIEHAGCREAVARLSDQIQHLKTEMTALKPQPEEKQ